MSAQEDTVQPYTDDADVRTVVRAIMNTPSALVHEVAAAVLDALAADGRMPAAHHQPLLTLDAEDVAALVTAAAMEAGTCPDPRLLAALDKIAEATRD